MLLPEWSVCSFPFTGPTGGRITRTPDIFPRHSIVSKKLYLFPMTRVKGLYKGSDSSSYLRVPGYTEAECVGTDVAQYTLWKRPSQGFKRGTLQSLQLQEWKAQVLHVDHEE